jgi:hypothetical protein
MSVQVTTGDRRADVLDGDAMADPIRRRTAIETSAVVSEAARAAATMLARSPGLLPPSWWSKVLKPDERDLAATTTQRSTSEQPMTSVVERTASLGQGESKLPDKGTTDCVSDAFPTLTAALQQSWFTSAEGSVCITEYGWIFRPQTLATVAVAVTAPALNADVCFKLLEANDRS